MSESRSAARRGRFLCLTALAFCAAGAPAVADVLAHYTFAGGSAASIDPHPDSTAGNMTIGAGLTGGYSAGNECAFASRATCGTTEGGAVTGNDYFQFTVTPGAGLALDLTSLRLRHMATTLEAGTDPIVTLCPDPAIVRPSAAAIENLIAHYDYTRLYYVSFFWVESAWWQMKIDGIT